MTRPIRGRYRYHIQSRLQDEGWRSTGLVSSDPNAVRVAAKALSQMPMIYGMVRIWDQWTHTAKETWVSGEAQGRCQPTPEQIEALSELARLNEEFGGD